MKKTIGLLAALAIMVLMAMPASAASPDAGVFAGLAQVGEPGAACDTSGDGLGFLPGDAAGGWSINAPAGSVASLLYGLGDLTLCGGLAPITQLGSCTSSTGYDGVGGTSFTHPVTSVVTTTSLSNVGWTASALGSFVVTGTADTGAQLTAVVQAFDDRVAVSCALDEAKAFNVVAAYVIR